MNSCALSSLSRIIITLLQTSAQPPSFMALGRLAAPAHVHQPASWGLRERGWSEAGQVLPVPWPHSQPTRPQPPQNWPSLPPGLQSHVLPLPSLLPPATPASFLFLWHTKTHPSLRTCRPIPTPLYHNVSSLDSGKAGAFLSLRAQLKHRHLREVLPGHSPLLAYRLVIHP